MAEMYFMNEDHNIPDSEIQKLVIGFFSGSLSSQEMKRLNNWLGETHSHVVEFNRMRSAWMLAHHHAGEKNFDALTGWPLLRQRIAHIRTIRFAAWMTPMRYAASLALCVVLTAATVMMWTPARRPSEAGEASL